ncbi:hypothetical protein MPSEU_001005200 [Mayamaea pseudoterrestris]|nr:hypothetical protein MPSEU_001005200 [Mayamaea pseudoterrestris]
MQLSCRLTTTLIRRPLPKLSASIIGITRPYKLKTDSRHLLRRELSTSSTTKSSGYSSFDEPHPSLFSTAALSSATVDSKDIDAQLRQDIRVMGSLLGTIIKEHDGHEIYSKVEDMRALAKSWRELGAGRVAETKVQAEETLQSLADYAAKFPDRDLFLVSRAFTHFLALANAAEACHRTRRLRDSDQDGNNSGALHAKPDSCRGVLPELLKQGHDVDDIYQALCSQVTELVLTAHPTEVNRRTILDKKRRIQDILMMADANRYSRQASQFETDELNKSMYREISSIWLSDEVSRIKPTPEVEAEKGTLFVDSVLWKTVPSFLRKLDTTMKEFLGKGLPFDAAPIRFASWMGGDRDGNPNVKPHTTRLVCLKNRAKAATLFKEDLVVLEKELSIIVASPELRAVVGNAREPYRALLKPMIARMQRTIGWAEAYINASTAGGEAMNPEEIYLIKQEFMDELLLMHCSLCETGNQIVADGLLTDIIRKVASFGLTLIPLDIRQESDKHEEAVDAITRFLGLGSYSQWDEATKISWLTTQIASKRPLLRPGIWREHPELFSETVVDVLETFGIIAEMYEDSLGAYVISQATSASDVLAVLLLQLDAGVKKPLRVAPLFETLDDLNGASRTMKTLFQLPVYMGIINGKQEVMIGYSDSAKDAGRLAAVWAQFETQEKLAQVGRDHSVDITFFHGKGGTVGRGGNPQTFKAIVAHPPKTINGKFRVTEQGEMITQNFGYRDRAERSMDIYTAAVLAEKLMDRPKPSKEWRDLMHTISTVSCDGYRQIVRKDSRFVPYFRSATPELELSSLNIGSRPAKRKPGGGVESLRAIPWNFAWTQTRLNLPSWLGVGEAFQSVLSSDKSPLLKEMYRDWSTFRTTVDLVEMVLSKSEPAIAKHYDDMLVTDTLAQELGSEVRQLHTATEDTILKLTGHGTLGENNNILRRALAVRNPYVDCLNILQVETLKRIRKDSEGEASKDLIDALLTTITGIANGMGNTG